MKTEIKFVIGTIVATIAVIIGAVFFLNKPITTETSTSEKADEKILIGEDSHKVSSSSASVTLVEFADFQCPACGAYHPVIKQLLAEFDGQINFVHRNFPLSMHKDAFLAAQAAEAAGKQWKFWEMHDMIFETQKEWSSGGSRKKLLGYAEVICIDTDKFEEDLKLQEIEDKIKQDVQDGYVLGVNSTPTFFVNGERITSNPSTYEDFQTIIRAASLQSPITQNENEKQHIHADFKVFVDG